MKKHDSVLIFIQLLFAGMIVLGSLYSVVFLKPIVTNKQVLGVKADMRHVDFVSYNFDSFFVADTSVIKNENTVKLIVSLKPLDQGKYYLGNLEIVEPGSYTITILPIDFPSAHMHLSIYKADNHLLLDCPNQDFVSVTQKGVFQVKLNALININTTSSFVIVITRAR